MCSSALGTALGPLLSTVFRRFPSLKAGPLTLDATTMGGWAMALAWLVFIAAWMVLFREPPQCARPPPVLALDGQRLASLRLLDESFQPRTGTRRMLTDARPSPASARRGSPALRSRQAGAAPCTAACSGAPGRARLRAWRPRVQPRAAAPPRGAARRRWSSPRPALLTGAPARARSAKAELNTRFAAPANPGADPAAAGVHEPLLGGDGTGDDLKAAEAGAAGKAAPEKAAARRAGCCADPYLPGTLAAIACLWVLKLTQQGYLDGLSIFTGPLFGARPAAASLGRVRVG